MEAADIERSNSVISLTQFIRPHGHKREITALVPEGCQKMVDKLLENEYKFSCEVLTTGEVALYCGKTEETEILHLSTNDDKVNLALKRLVLDAYQQLTNEASKG